MIIITHAAIRTNVTQELKNNINVTFDQQTVPSEFLDNS